jgi:hypothetical protein
MSRSLLVCVLALAAAWASTPPRAEAARETNILASAHDSPLEAGIGPIQLRDLGGVAIRSAQELVALSSRADAATNPAVQKELTAELATLLEVSAIDWNKQMVLAVRGTPGTKLDRIQFDALTVEGKVLTVTWKVNQRPPHAGLGTPVALILVERSDEVKFVERGRK